MTECINKQVRPLSAVESERHFFEVGLEMLRAQFMPATAQAALEKRESGFDGVGVSVAANVFFGSVLDNLVASLVVSHPASDATIDVKFIGEEYVYILSDVIAEKLFKGFSSYFVGMEKPQFAVALTDAEHWPFLGAAPANPFSVPLSTDVGFVHLDLAREHWFIGLGHRSADSVAEVPRGFVADSKRPLNLAGRHTFLGFAEQERSDKPFCQGKVGVIENRARRDGELVVTILAVEKLFVGFQFYDGHLAARAFHASGPAQARQQFAALFICREQGVYVN